MLIENARLAAYLSIENPSELKRRSCIALFQSTGEKACRDEVLAHMDKNSGMSLLFALEETGDDACRLAMEELMDNTTKTMVMDDSMTKIVLEGAKPFFEGERSAEDVARQIQSKVTILVNEQM